MKSIASRQNPWFKRVRDAMREHAEEIVIEGPKQVNDAIAAGWSPIALVECGGPAAAGTPSGGGAAGPPTALHIDFSVSLFDAVSDTKTSQGILGLFHRPPSRFAADKLVVALDGVQDPGNVGTIVRLAGGLDAGGARPPGCADPFSPKAIRASAGAILNVPIAEVSVQQLIDAGRPLLYADAVGVAEAPSRDAILVLGSEGRGVSEEIREHGRAIAIKTTGRVESLNVAAAAAILLWQSFR